MKYDKLIRNNIPHIIKGKGQTPKYHTASPNEHFNRAMMKLLEEAEEFSKDKNAEELADILEVIHLLCDVIGVLFDDVEELRRKKAEERGTFSEFIILDEVV